MPGVRDFLLINDTDSLYPLVKPIQYPKAGTTNSAVRVGRGDRRRRRHHAGSQVPGDPRNNYIARMEWADDSERNRAAADQPAAEHGGVMLAEPGPATARPVFTERDSAWVDVVDDLAWLAGGKGFLWMSERDGWRHAYRVSRDGSGITPGDQRRLRHGLGGGGRRGGGLDLLHRLTRQRRPSATSTGPDSTAAAGRAGYPGGRRAGPTDIRSRPTRRLAFHKFSRFDRPPSVDLVRLPSHSGATPGRQRGAQHGVGRPSGRPADGSSGSTIGERGDRSTAG